MSGPAKIQWHGKQIPLDSTTISGHPILLVLKPDIVFIADQRQPGVPSKSDGGREAGQGGSTAHRREPSEEHPSSGTGSRTFTGARDGGGTGSGTHRGQALRIGEPACCPGEALLWQRSEPPDGTSGCCWRRCGLAGMIPEALCGEAPQGQPMIRREPLVAVCVEAPQGQPGNHRPKESSTAQDQRGKG